VEPESYGRLLACGEPTPMRDSVYDDGRSLTDRAYRGMPQYQSEFRGYVRRYTDIGGPGDGDDGFSCRMGHVLRH